MSVCLTLVSMNLNKNNVDFYLLSHKKVRIMVLNATFNNISVILWLLLPYK